MNNEVNILHLSDLHIEDQSSDGQNEISFSLQNLIKDVSEELQNINELIIVVSGDVLFQASYDRDADTVVKFFDELKLAIGDKIKGIIFVPGNHDIERGENETNIRNNINRMDEQANRSIQFEGYNKYLKTINKIRKNYGLTSKKQKTFGVEVVECNGIPVAFQYIDTAWGVISKTTKGNIAVGHSQLKYIEKQYKDKVISQRNNNPIGITIAVSHYPLAWLRANEGNDLIASMMDVNFLNTDILLCGHTHDTEVLNYNNHEHSLTTLVTGIGWGINRPSDAKDQHRYSIYQLSLSKNTCEIIMKRSQNNQKYDYDYSVYTEEQEKQEKKIVYPLKINGRVGFLKLNAFNKIDTKNIQVSNEILAKMNMVATSISRFRESCSLLLEFYKNEHLRDFKAICIQNGKETLYTNVRDFLFNDVELFDESLNEWSAFCNSNIAKTTFESFLKDICRKFIGEFEELFVKKTIVRTHFRKHSFKKDGSSEYVMICEDNNGFNTSMPPKSVPWGGLIKYSYKSNKSLLYSVNTRLNNIQTEWGDFITLVPRFEGEEIEIRVGSGKKTSLEKRPLISFGISIKNGCDYNSVILSIISFFEIEQHISYFIDEYVRLFKVSLKNIYKS